MWRLPDSTHCYRTYTTTLKHSSHSGRQACSRQLEKVRTGGRQPASLFWQEMVGTVGCHSVEGLEALEARLLEDVGMNDLVPSHLEEVKTEDPDQLTPNHQLDTKIHCCEAAGNMPRLLVGKMQERFQLKGKCTRGDSCKYLRLKANDGKKPREQKDCKGKSPTRGTEGTDKKSNMTPTAPVEIVDNVDAMDVCAMSFWLDDETSDTDIAYNKKKRNENVTFAEKVEVIEFHVEKMMIGLTNTLRKKSRAKAATVDAARWHSPRRSVGAKRDTVVREERWMENLYTEDQGTHIIAVARKWLIDTGSAYDLVSAKDAVLPADILRRLLVYTIANWSHP
eukprot:2048482-Amphidinium_carterae.1